MSAGLSWEGVEAFPVLLEGRQTPGEGSERHEGRVLLSMEKLQRSSSLTWHPDYLVAWHPKRKKTDSGA